MNQFTVYAEAWGTYVCVVDADNVEDAKIKSETADRELVDAPEVGDIVRVEEH